MTKPIRSGFIGSIALLQVALLPTTLVMHIGCGHSHQLPTVKDQVSTCHSHTHCHHHTHSDPHQNEPPEPVHDPDSCAVCQLAFAAQVADSYISEVPSCGLSHLTPVTLEKLFGSRSWYALPVRGPPTASWTC